VATSVTREPRRECVIRGHARGAAVIGLAVSVAFAQEDPIVARKQLMKDNGDRAKAGAAVAKGEAPFDLAAARKMFVQFEDSDQGDYPVAGELH